MAARLAAGLSVALSQAAVAAIGVAVLPRPEALDQPRFETVGADAIPRDVVSAIAQDRQGFLWVGTGDGLVRYDGYRFRPLERDTPDPARRSLGWVSAMLATSDGRLWLAPEPGGVAIYDPRTEQLLPAPAWPAGELPPQVLAMTEAPGGGAWVGTDGQGLVRLDAAGRLVPVPWAEPLRGEHVQALALRADGELWIGTWQGLWWHDPVSGGLELVRAVDGTPSDRARGAPFDLATQAVQALVRTSDDRLWIGTRQGHLLRVDAGDRMAVRLAPSAAGAPGGTGAIHTMVENGGELWVGRDTGIDRLDLRAGGTLIGRMRHDPRLVGGLAGDGITTMLRDQAGSVWVGGPGVGLQRHDPHRRGIWVRGADPLAGGPFSDPDIRSLLRLDDGRLWAATRSSGIAVLDEGLHVQGAVRLRAPGRADRRLLAGAPLPQVDAMTQDAAGVVWLASSTELYAFDRDGHALRHLQLAAPVRDLLGSADGGLWIATRDGLYFRPADEVDDPAHAARSETAAPSGPSTGVAASDARPALQRIRVASAAADAPAPAGLSTGPERAGASAVALRAGPTVRPARPLDGEVYTLSESPDGVLWVGTAHGLYLREPGQPDLRRLESPPGAGLGSPTVLGLLVDRENRLWVDTSVAGLHRLLERKGTMARFDPVSLRLGRAGRPFGANLLEDTRGRIWTHMHVYDPAADTLQALTPADGVRFGTGWFGSYARMADGRLLFGGSKGLLVVDAGHVGAAPYEPPLRISELRVDGQRETAWRAGQTLRLLPDDRSISVEAAALDYGDPRRVHYAWRLRGYDEGWIEGGEGQRTASYGHLPPGRYTLEMRASNAGGSWRADDVMLAIEVLPAWWQTWWSRSLAALLAATLVWALVQWRTRRLRADQARLEHLVSARTHELEATARALEESSLTDPLTGLRNRRYLSQHLEPEAQLLERRALDRQHREQPPTEDDDLVFFLIDIDHFKDVNDQHGHAAGDAVLVEVAQRLRAVFRESDHLVRWGGEEFLVVARGTARGEAAGLAERVRRQIGGHPFEAGGGARLVRTCSIGYAAYPLAQAASQALGWSETVALADRALYIAKRSGRDGWLGLVRAPDVDVDGLRARSGQSLAIWATTGGLEVRASMPGAVWQPVALNCDPPGVTDFPPPADSGVERAT